MPIRSRTNQYNGINAHYQSIAQHEMRGWKPFHSVHITHLMEHIQDRLPPGYQVEPEDSLQIQIEERTHLPSPFDLAIWEFDTEHPPVNSGAQTATAIPVAVRDIVEFIDSEDELSAVVISEVREDGTAIPVTRLELLSPTNKEGEGLAAYLRGKLTTLLSGTSLVEIDYLHETDSLIRDMPGYASKEKDAYPYTIVVSDPRPVISKGQMKIYGFHVDEPLLPIEIPLARQDSFTIDFGAVYQHTLENTIAFHNRVNYARQPVNFETYMPADQLRIWARMLAVIEAKKSGQKMEQGHFPALIDEPALKLLKERRYVKAALLVNEETFEMCWLAQWREDSLGVIFREKTLVRDLVSGSTAPKTFERLKSIFEDQGWIAFMSKLDAML